MPSIYHEGIEAQLAKRGRYYQLTWRVDGERFRKSTGSETLSEAGGDGVQDD